MSKKPYETDSQFAHLHAAPRETGIETGVRTYRTLEVLVDNDGIIKHIETPSSIR